VAEERLKTDWYYGRTARMILTAGHEEHGPLADRDVLRAI
jgi:hypothetical protein